MNTIGHITPLSQVASAYATAQLTPARNSSDFGTLVGDAAHAALDTMRKAERTTAQGVAGKADAQDVVQALSSAEVTMQTVVAIRDKVVSAYNSILTMSV
jgi:flagellar hook-basal body complex protein FliE